MVHREPPRDVRAKHGKHEGCVLDIPNDLLRLLKLLYTVRGRGERRLLALASKERLERILQVMLDEDEFLSEHGIRSCVCCREDITDV